MAGTVDQSLDLTIVDDQLEIKLASSSSSVSSSSPQQPQDFDFVDDIEVLSEVHTDTPEAHATSKEGEPKPIVVTRFQARVQVHVAEKRPKPDLDSECAVDSDGDLEVVRRKYSTFDVEIPHTMATKIPEVGLQVWAGALLMADYIVHNRDQWVQSTVLELGAGTGLASIVMARYAQTVLCTDFVDSVLINCVKAVKRNDVDANVSVRHLDWTRFPSTHTTDTSAVDVCNYLDVHDAAIKESQRFSWSKTDLESLEAVTILLAADVVYVDEWTTAFSDCLYELLRAGSTKNRHLLLTIEKRINFSLDVLHDVAPAYDHFRVHILDSTRFIAAQITVDFPVIFSNYQRSKHLQLWKISLNTP
eukprot:m.82391 g.82391  ORF g.82391 m.82391 type:complete len:361 (-) comp25513_c1_seq2:68-1150(-)